MNDHEKASETSRTALVAGGRRPHVFVSYAHENDEHKANVATLATVLRDNGMEVFFDQWRTSSRIDWNQTITNWIQDADFVLTIASAAYLRAAEGRTPDGVNLGIQHELSIIRELLNGDRATWLPKIIPVILPDWSIEDIPRVFQPTTANRYEISEVSEDGMAKLIKLLHRRPGEGQRSSPGESRTQAVRRKVTEVATRRSTVVTSVALTAAAAVGLVAMNQFGGINQTTTLSGPGNSVEQYYAPCAQLVNSDCEIKVEKEAERASESSATDAELKAELAKDAKAAPTGAGPWPFMVVDTMNGDVNLGLYARSTNRLQGDHLGTAPNRSVVWADCVATSDYTPQVESIRNVGPQWLYVHWRAAEPTANSVSDPGRTGFAWMYLGGVVPVGHNGEIPKCHGLE